MLTLDNVCYTYQTKAQTVEALRGVSAEFEAGQFYALVGPSGSGKTTLLSLLAGLDVPASGEIRWNGAATATMDLDRFRFDHVSVIYQNFNLFAHLTALENAAYPLYLRGLPKKEAEAQAAERLEQVGITADKRNRLPSHLSGGEQQRIAIARALASDTELILADEPTGNLDSENGMRIIELLSELAHEENRCVIVVTHDPKVADQADEILQMEDGRLSLPSVVIEES